METQLSFKDRAKQAFYFYAGIGQGVVDTAKGLAKLSLLPAIQGLDTLEKTADFISHPQEKAEAAYQEARQDYKDLQRLWDQPKEEILKRSERLGHAVQHEWNEFTKPFESSDPNVRAKAWGETTFNVASLFYGPGELKGVLAVEKEASLLSKAAGLEEAGLKILAQTEKKIIPEAAELLAQGANGFEKETLLSKINPEGVGELKPQKFTVHEGKQGKHILGHNNFDLPRSILTHPDPQGLVDKFAGTGKAMGPGKIFPEAGYKERIDFGETIGKFYDKEAKTYFETTIGSIDYAKNDVHIVPRSPRK
ncbi:MAG: hypothetical protein HQM15_08685 [Deltaproteobacteria bacterium]|nr:hypothetical protein [Deltaproteobacteria bacterium]